MGVSDTIALIAISLVFTYYLIYKKNRIVGNILFLVIGAATAYQGSTEAIYGVIIIAVSWMSFIYDALKPNKKKGSMANLWTRQ